MPWVLVGVAVVVLFLAALAARGGLGEMPGPPVEDDWHGPAGEAAGEAGEDPTGRAGDARVPPA